MLKEGEVYFNNNTSINLNLFLQEYPSIPLANEEYEEVPVEGRNGTLFINKNTYPNKEILFTFTILSENIEIDFEKVYEWLTEIEDNRMMFGRQDRCYTVKKILFANLKKEFRSRGEFEITFICEPFSCDLDPIIYEITSNNFSFYYNGNAPGEPLIKVYGSGNIQLIINGETMVISNVTSYVEIDSKLSQVRNLNLTSKDYDTIGDFALFTKGKNTIAYTGTVTNILVEYTNNYK